MPRPAVLAAALRSWLPRLQGWHFPRAGEIVRQHDPAVFEYILRRHIERPEALAI